MGAAALQKYIGSLGGIGASGVGSSSSYAPKELNKEVTPEKVSVSSSCAIADLCFIPSNSVLCAHLHMSSKHLHTLKKYACTKNCFSCRM